MASISPILVLKSFPKAEYLDLIPDLAPEVTISQH
jgi:hypothetical protein